MSEISFEVDDSWMDSEEWINSRILSVAEDSREAVQLVLRYLFVSGGPVSIERSVKAAAQEHLSIVENFLLQWLHKRTDGKLRRHYGARVLDAVKRSRYRCERCGFRDVRALNLEKTEESDERGGTQFVCLCANCNIVAARAKEMAALAVDRERTAQAAAVTEGEATGPLDDRSEAAEAPAPAED